MGGRVLIGSLKSIVGREGVLSELPEAGDGDLDDLRPSLRLALRGVPDPKDVPLRTRGIVPVVDL